MLRFLLGMLPSGVLQNICNICAHQLFKRRYWRNVNSSHPELQCPKGVQILACKIEKWEWKVLDANGNELCHGVSPTAQLATLDGHMWVELLGKESCNTKSKNVQ